MDINECSVNNITCPVGIKNTSDIEHLSEKMTIMIEQISKDTKEIKKEVKELSAKVDDINTNLETKIEEVEKSIPEIVDKKIEEKRNTSAGIAWKWIFGSLGGAILITIVPQWISRLLGL